MNHELLTRHGFGLVYIWTSNDEDDEINRVLAKHEKNKKLHERANIAHARANKIQILAQGAQVVVSHPLEQPNLAREEKLWKSKMSALEEQVKKQIQEKPKMTLTLCANNWLVLLSLKR